MKLLSVITAEGPRLAAKLDSGILIFSDVDKLLSEDKGSLPLTLQEALTADKDFSQIVSRLQAVIANSRVNQYVRPEGEVKIARPFVPGNVICVGLNYKDHAEESNIALPEQPVLFAKWTGAMIGPNDPIVLPLDTKEVDYEAELAVVIGRECSGVRSEDALDYVAGYTCLNDVSARDFQRGDGQWVRAKSQDTFGPFGPYLVTKDDVPDPQTLNITCSVNGRVLQNSNTSKMIFSVRDLIAFISRGVTLRPGDVISTGTPHGVGFAHKPPVFLKAGDQVIVGIESIGQLSNPVKAR
ncbi:MAG TPA: fumarylacetoacetate hydrolase family protein [Edaphobacter sp.]|nr:fumarylacetoacetate hydrolase family protein [Edaphobacter sp.]